MRKLFAYILIAVLLSGCVPSSQIPTGTTAVPSQPPVVTATQTQPTETTVPASTAAPDPVEIVLSSLTLEEKVGQLFLARCPSTGAVADIANYHLGGYILFARDFENETPDSVRAKIRSYQNASRMPMLIAVDEEGGSVNRVSKYPAFREKPFSSPRNLYRNGGLALIENNELEKCQLLTSLGINVNAAPVCDVVTDPNAFMYRRSLGESPQITGEFVSSVVQIMLENRVGGILKHFPGYGNNTDTHTAIAVDQRPLSQLEAEDLVPFAAGIASGAQAIMVSHVYIHAIDPGTPATLSPAVHTYLRENMGFTGVIVTDDLAMKAITDTYGVGESAILAVLAGNDLLCCSDYREQYRAVLQAVKDGRIPLPQLDAAVSRIIQWKMELELL